jgi:hypothetical protein
VFGGVGVNAFMRFDGRSRTNIGEWAVSDVDGGAFRARLWPAVFAGLAI